MTIETEHTTHTEVQLRADSPKRDLNRKRPAGEEPKTKPLPVKDAPKKTKTGEEEKPEAKVANNGWGELFKDRDTFVKMHLF